MSIDTIVGYAVTFVISPLVGFLLGALRERAKRAKQEDSAIEAGVRVLLGDKLLSVWQEAKEDEFITVEKLAMARDVYEQYHNLGGNGVGTERMNEMGRMPIKEATR